MNEPSDSFINSILMNTAGWSEGLCESSFNLLNEINLGGNCLEAKEPWPGDYGFKCIVDDGAGATYSPKTSKLYVNLDTPCAFNFSASTPPENCTINAQFTFTNPNKPSERVTRCPNHLVSTDPTNTDVPNDQINHVLRCQGTAAHYDTSLNGEYFVSIPYVPPPVGCAHSSYLYKFMCHNSCLGGIERRQTSVVFTLDLNGKILGRDIVKVKVCSCPKRDRREEEKKLRQKSKQDDFSSVPKKKKIKTETGSSTEDDDNRKYNIEVTNKGHYKILMDTKASLEKYALPK